MLFFHTKMCKRILRYILFVAIVCRVLISVYIGYQYVWFSSESLSAKGGTFVEGIFDKTSYLPYLSNDPQSLFYQGLLFNNCIKDTASGVTPSDLCRVYTEDNQHFVIALNPWFIWSDGTPMNIEDIFFTYHDIVHQNKWDIPRLDIYKDIVIIKDTDNKLKISFPSPSKDNISFFGQYILPQHILQEYDLESYKKMFGVLPVYTNCANVVTESTDSNSLIFNLANCIDTNLNFYQIKNAGSFSEFNTRVHSAQDSIIDAYIGPETIDGYISKPLTTNKIVAIFFNTNSLALRVRTRRVLWWLIKHNFYTTGYENFLTKNTDGLFDTFQSTWSNAKDLINRDYSAGSITKEDLLDINIAPLPANITISKEGQQQVYFVDSGTQFTLQFTFPGNYDRISIDYKWQLASSIYDKKAKTATFSIGGTHKNFGSGINKYVLYGYIKKEKKRIASLDLYNVIGESSSHEEGSSDVPQQKLQITVIYYDSPLYNFVVERMQTIFRQADILDNFVFDKMETPEELQGRLFAGDYDVFVSVVDMGTKKDFTQLFGTEKSELNPSQYQNQKMSTMLRSYMESNSKRQLNEINSMYSKDMPFVIMGNVFTKLNIKPHLALSLRGSGDTQINESNRRSLVYQKLQLVSNIHIDGKKVWSRSNFIKFLEDNIQ